MLKRINFYLLSLLLTMFTSVSMAESVPISASYKYSKYYSKYFLEIQFKDALSVTDIQVNRGNCQLHTSEFNYRLDHAEPGYPLKDMSPYNAKFGSVINLWSDCKPLELKFSTNKGDATLSF